jgi:hypothetical protein
MRFVDSTKPHGKSGGLTAGLKPRPFRKCAMRYVMLISPALSAGM